ncbi:hypothetical protein BDR04DRAFT_876837 [Suillus decipiens]|nr:hypothetical protein BDR04DRAFT_876837 [Suillus decipiens]
MNDSFFITHQVLELQLCPPINLTWLALFLPSLPIFFRAPFFWHSQSDSRPGDLIKRLTTWKYLTLPPSQSLCWHFCICTQYYRRSRCCSPRRISMCFTLVSSQWWKTFVPHLSHGASVYCHTSRTVWGTGDKLFLGSQCPPSIFAYRNMLPVSSRCSQFWGGSELSSVVPVVASCWCWMDFVSWQHSLGFSLRF